MLKMKSYVLMLLSITSLLLSNILSKRCGLHLLKKPARILIKQEEDSNSLFPHRRSILEQEYEPIRIHMDYSQIESMSPLDDKLKKDYLDLKEKIMPKTQEVFQKILKVKRMTSKLKLPASKCDEAYIPNKYQFEGLDADLVIFVTLDTTGYYFKNGVEAAAMHCLQDADTHRPIAGFITFRPKMGIKDSTDVDYFVWLALHEISHILAFSEWHYPDYIDPTTLDLIGYENVITSTLLPSGKKMNMIKTQKVLEKGKEHYKCNNYTGSPLEYNGGPGTAGSHWSKKYMNTDYMIGDSYGENLISDITLALFEDSGWYKPDYEMANLFLWGKNKGCGFMDKDVKCIEQDIFNGNKTSTPFGNEFCTNINYPTCSVSNTFRGHCKTKKYRDALNLYERYFADPNVGGTDRYTDKCPIAIEARGDQWYYGGSCRVGHKKIEKFERVCPECACFMSNLENKEKNHTITNESHWTQAYAQTQNQTQNQTQTQNNTKLLRRMRFKEKQNIKNRILHNENHDKHKTDSLFEGDESMAFSKTALANEGEPMPKLTSEDLKAQCFDYECREHDLYVRLEGNSYKCGKHGESIRIPGFNGNVVCPNAEDICHKKFKCKFGCVEFYDNAKHYSTFK